MLNKSKTNPALVTEVFCNKGHEAISTPVVPNSKATNISDFNFRFRKKTDKKLMNKGFVATDNTPMPAVTCCMAVM